ncbi:putative crustin-like antimicrobial peptide 20 [Homarus americanus]|uniref:Putative crustin-like antimicrobial peptide 20 n=1 Tax=Homarus americanus TaxID=6706 RepID=A0A8J5JKQ1_HOMAM|nr:putative crustin-like antimicrobial peptide 20 [Homarus americanus]
MMKLWLVVCVVGGWQVSQGAGQLPCLADPIQPDCIAFCPNNYNGEYFCCDTNGNNPGQCPKYRLTADERSLLCDPTQHNYPYHLNCKSDTDCFAWEKCCYLPENNQRICRSSV